MQETGGINLGHLGKRFTWDYGQGRLALIRERKDKTLANHPWITFYPKAMVEHLNLECSDHCLILVCTKGFEPSP